MSNYESYKTLVFSTAHLLEKDSVLLNMLSSHSSNGVELTHYGWRIITLPAFTKMLQERGLSSHTLNILKIARSKRAKWIEFDQDGEKYPGLPEFDW